MFLQTRSKSWREVRTLVDVSGESCQTAPVRGLGRSREEVASPTERESRGRGSTMRLFQWGNGPRAPNVLRTCRGTWVISLPCASMWGSQEVVHGRSSERRVSLGFHSRFSTRRSTRELFETSGDSGKGPIGETVGALRVQPHKRTQFRSAANLGKRNE